MNKLLILVALFVGIGLSTHAQSANADYSGLLKTVTLTDAVVDSTLVTISGSRSAITFKYDITKTSGTVAGTIALQYKVTTLGSERWYTYNTYTLTDATAIATVELPRNMALKWKILTTKTGTSVTTNRYYLLYRK